MDKGSFGGIVVAIGGILLGLAIEGGKIGQILQPTAALIVFGGTLGAVMVQFPLSVVMAAFASLAHVFFERGEDPGVVVKELVRYAQKARKDGIVSLDDPLSATTISSTIPATLPRHSGKSPAAFFTIIDRASVGIVVSGVRYAPQP